MIFGKNMLGSLAIFLTLVGTLPARTIILTADDCDEMASISEQAPRLSWAMQPPGNSVYNTEPTLYWNNKIALLMRFPLADKIPKGQRVTKAELTISANYVAGTPEIHVRRLLAEWGAGVCQQYRLTRPQKIEWSQPGGRGAGTDRAARDSAFFKFTKIGEQTADLTEDVELWHTGAANNRGWILTLEPDGNAYFPSPYSPLSNGGKHWKLQITYEPS